MTPYENLIMVFGRIRILNLTKPESVYMSRDFYYRLQCDIQKTEITHILGMPVRIVKGIVSGFLIKSKDKIPTNRSFPTLISGIDENENPAIYMIESRESIIKCEMEPLK